MPWQIKATAQLDDADAKAMAALSSAVFPPRKSAPDPRIPSEWLRPEWHMLYWNEGRALAYVGALAREILCDGEPAFVGGIGGVKTHPQHRGRGHASAGIQLAIDHLHAQLKVDFTAAGLSAAIDQLL